MPETWCQPNNVCDAARAIQSSVPLWKPKLDYSNTVLKWPRVQAEAAAVVPQYFILFVINVTRVKVGFSGGFQVQDMCIYVHL